MKQNKPKIIKKAKSVSQRAVDFVIEYEKKNNRKAKPVKQGRGYDVISTGRKIEVKGVAHSRPPFIKFNQYNFGALQKENRFYLYIVYNLQEKPKLIIMKKNEVLKRAKFEFGWEIPLWVKDFK